MSDDDQENDIGSVQVKVSPAAVHRAVRNILANEMGMSRQTIEEMIREMVKEIAEKKIGDFTLDYLRDNGWNGARLQERVKAAMDRQIADLKPIIKDVARDLVGEAIREDVEGVVEAIVRDGLKVRLGWAREARVVVEPAGHAGRSWIAVDDRLPPDKAEVLVYHGNVYNDGRDVGPAIYADGKFWGAGNPLVKVSHWRSFPDAPRKGGEDAT